MKRLTLFLSLLLATSAFAGIEPRFSTAFALPDDRVAVNWRLRLVSGALDPGASFSQHFTIYDIPGLLLGDTRQPEGWVVSFQSRGIDADDIGIRGGDDSAKYMNVTWTWTGSTRIEAPMELGIFGITKTGSDRAGRNLFIAQVSRDELAGGPLAAIGRVYGASGFASLLWPGGPVAWLRGDEVVRPV